MRKRCNAGTANRNRHLESGGLGPPRRRDILLKRPPPPPSSSHLFPPLFAHGAPSILQPPALLKSEFSWFPFVQYLKRAPNLHAQPVSGVRQLRFAAKSFPSLSLTCLLAGGKNCLRGKERGRKFYSPEKWQLEPVKMNNCDSPQMEIASAWNGS